MLEYLENEMFSDVEIYHPASSTKLRCHGIVLATKSAYWKRRLEASVTCSHESKIHSETNQCNGTSSSHSALRENTNKEDCKSTQRNTGKKCFSHQNNNESEGTGAHCASSYRVLLEDLPSCITSTTLRHVIRFMYTDYIDVVSKFIMGTAGCCDIDSSVQIKSTTSSESGPYRAHFPGGVSDASFPLRSHTPTQSITDPLSSVSQCSASTLERSSQSTTCFLSSQSLRSSSCILSVRSLDESFTSPETDTLKPIWGVEDERWLSRHLPCMTFLASRWEISTFFGLLKKVLPEIMKKCPTFSLSLLQELRFSEAEVSCEENNLLTELCVRNLTLFVRIDREVLSTTYSSSITYDDAVSHENTTHQNQVAAAKKIPSFSQGKSCENMNEMIENEVTLFSDLSFGEEFITYTNELLKPSEMLQVVLNTQRIMGDVQDEVFDEVDILSGTSCENILEPRLGNCLTTESPRQLLNLQVSKYLLSLPLDCLNDQESLFQLCESVSSPPLDLTLDLFQFSIRIQEPELTNRCLKSISSDRSLLSKLLQKHQTDRTSSLTPNDPEHNASCSHCSPQKAYSVESENIQRIPYTAEEYAIGDSNKETSRTAKDSDTRKTGAVLPVAEGCFSVFTRPQHEVPVENCKTPDAYCTPSSQILSFCASSKVIGAASMRAPSKLPCRPILEESPCLCSSNLLNILSRVVSRGLIGDTRFECRDLIEHSISSSCSIPLNQGPNVHASSEEQKKEIDVALSQFDVAEREIFTKELLKAYSQQQILRNVSASKGATIPEQDILDHFTTFLKDSVYYVYEQNQTEPKLTSGELKRSFLEQREEMGHQRKRIRRTEAKINHIRNLVHRDLSANKSKYQNLKERDTDSPIHSFISSTRKSLKHFRLLQKRRIEDLDKYLKQSMDLMEQCVHN